MSRVRYETRCGGRLLKVIDQVEVPDLADPPPGWPLDLPSPPYPTAEAAAEATARYRAENDVPVVDGSWYWQIDGQRVEADVAMAMLAKHGEMP